MVVFCMSRTDETVFNILSATKYGTMERLCCAHSGHTVNLGFGTALSGHSIPSVGHSEATACGHHMIVQISKPGEKENKGAGSPNSEGTSLEVHEIS